MGPRAGAGVAEATDGLFFDVVAGGIHHRYSEELSGPLRAAFDMTTVELRADGRYDLRRYARSLTGSFVEASAGVGIGAYHYPAASTSEANTLLLARFGFGIYLGRHADCWGELRAYYDYRHDDYAGGFKMPGLGSGPLGHFGVDGRAFVTPHWGFRAEVQVGSAWLGRTGPGLPLREGCAVSRLAAAGLLASSAGAARGRRRLRGGGGGARPAATRGSARRRRPGSRCRCAAGWRRSTS